MPSTSTPRTVDILGTQVHDVTYLEALDCLGDFIKEGGPHRIVTPNPEIAMTARHDSEFRAILNSSDLAIPDGIGLLVAGSLLGRRLRQHVRGTDLVLQLAAHSVAEGWRWFLLGAEPGVAPAATAKLQARFPGLQIAGTLAGSPLDVDDGWTRERIAEAGPVQVLLVAFGAPKQERWIARNQLALGVPIQMGVGGAFNFFAGRSRRAPSWVRRLELEWAFRLATEPWRLRRQMALPQFALLAVAQAVHQRRALR
jgi:N-acetylglucosaminyldiphosphoundecaprenol N-acetyl-beta-D-mannosaminyltransferase